MYEINFKIRASKANELTTGSIGLTEAQKATLKDFKSREGIALKPITDKQRETLKSLHSKMMDKGLTKKEEDVYLDLDARKDIKASPLTPKQREDMESLIEKSKNNDLPQTVKTLAINWLNDVLHQQTVDIGNKYTQKGNMQEGESLKLIAKFLGIPEFALEKNEQFFENEWAKGTPDALPLTPNIVVDAKSSWSHQTFPLHKKNPDPTYWSQMQIYMWLTGRRQALIAHTLVDTPNELVKHESYKVANELGVEWSEDLFDRVRENHVHGHKPIFLRVKPFYVDYDPSYIDEVKRRVPMVRDYIRRLLDASPDLTDIFITNTSLGIKI